MPKSTCETKREITANWGLCLRYTGMLSSWTKQPIPTLILDTDKKGRKASTIAYLNGQKLGQNKSL